MACQQFGIALDVGKLLLLAGSEQQDIRFEGDDVRQVMRAQVGDRFDIPGDAFPGVYQNALTPELAGDDDLSGAAGTDEQAAVFVLAKFHGILLL